MKARSDNVYQCPFCIAAQGLENSHTMIKQADIFYKDDLVMTLINSKFIPSNPGHVIIVLLVHIPNLYTLTEEVGARLLQVAKKVALAVKNTRECESITLQQNNEPAGGQHALHFHLHVFPRFENDHFSSNLDKAYVSDPKDRVKYAQKLKQYFNSLQA